MKNTLAILAIAATTAFGQQYKADAASAPPASLSAELQKMLNPQGVKVLDDKGKVYCEVWLRATEPPAGKSVEENITLPEIPHGALLGVITFPADAEDRRGQKVKAGTYTLRYSHFPVNGDHQGAAPQRDFLVLSTIADDTAPTTDPKYADLMNQARKASGTTHPLVFSLWKADSATGGFAKEGDHDWVLQKNVGKTPLSIILIGRAEG